MREYLTEAIVLESNPAGDADKIFSLFTKKFGKFVAKAKSARKITSKLSPHLEPGSLSRVRIIERNGLQVVDSLLVKKLDMRLEDMRNLSKLLSEHGPDLRLWNEIEAGLFGWRSALRTLGWDPDVASCFNCGVKPFAMAVDSQDFFCKNCFLREGQPDSQARSLRAGGDEVIYI